MKFLRPPCLFEPRNTNEPATKEDTASHPAPDSPVMLSRRPDAKSIRMEPMVTAEIPYPTEI
jgi:hypothetical protein